MPTPTEISSLIEHQGTQLFEERSNEDHLDFTLLDQPVRLQLTTKDFRNMGKNWLLKLQSQLSLTALEPNQSLQDVFKPSNVSLQLDPQMLSAQSIDLHHYLADTSLSLYIATRPIFQKQGIGSGLMRLYNLHIRSILRSYPEFFTDCSAIEKIIDNSGNTKDDQYTLGPSSKWASQLGFTQDSTNKQLWTRTPQL